MVDVHGDPMHIRCSALGDLITVIREFWIVEGS